MSNINKLTFTLEDLIEMAAAKKAKKQTEVKPEGGKKRGRPAGSKNKPKNGEVPVEEKLVQVSTEIRDGKEVLILKEPGFNYRFARGFYYHNVVKPMNEGIRPKESGWKWEPTAGVRVIPVEDLELLLTGLRDTYKGSKLVMTGPAGAETISL